MADQIVVKGWGVMYRYPAQGGGYGEVLNRRSWWPTRDEARAFIAERRPGFQQGESMRVVRLAGVLSPVRKADRG